MSPDPRATSELSVEGIDLADRAFWAQDAAARDAAFDVLRRERPVSRYRAADSVMLPPDADSPGFWAVTRYEDVRTVSRDADTFCSSKGVVIDDVPELLLEGAQSFLAMDAPRHTKVRGLVQKAFTPRQMRRIEDEIAAQARLIVDEFLEAGDGVFVKLVSMRLPMMTINALIGVPAEDQERLADAADLVVGWNDPEVVGARHGADRCLYGGAHHHPRRGGRAHRAAAQGAGGGSHDRPRPGGDRRGVALRRGDLRLPGPAHRGGQRHVSPHHERGRCGALARLPGPARTADGRRGGRHRSSGGGMLALDDPRDDLPPHGHAGHRDRGQAIAEGDKVVMVYRSANRDESVFEDPYRFDVARTPNRHLAFGGGGPHFCLGSSLARTQLRCVIGELLRRVDHMELGESEHLVANFITGMKRMPVSVKAS